MPRIGGVDLPKKKRIVIALTYIYGIGNSVAAEVLEKTGVNPSTRAESLTDDEVSKLRAEIEREIQIEGDLKRTIQMNKKRLMDLGCHRGLRHRRGLPVRGQRTKTNARTRKGPKKQAVAGKKKALKK